MRLTLGWRRPPTLLESDVVMRPIGPRSLKDQSGTEATLRHPTFDQPVRYRVHCT